MTGKRHSTLTHNEQKKIYESRGILRDIDYTCHLITNYSPFRTKKGILTSIDKHDSIFIYNDVKLTCEWIKLTGTINFSNSSLFYSFVIFFFVRPKRWARVWVCARVFIDVKFHISSDYQLSVGNTCSQIVNKRKVWSPPTKFLKSASTASHDIEKTLCPPWLVTKPWGTFWL